MLAVMREGCQTRTRLICSISILLVSYPEQANSSNTTAVNDSSMSIVKRSSGYSNRYICLSQVAALLRHNAHFGQVGALPLESIYSTREPQTILAFNLKGKVAIRDLTIQHFQCRRPT